MAKYVRYQSIKKYNKKIISAKIYQIETSVYEKKFGDSKNCN